MYYYLEHNKTLKHKSYYNSKLDKFDELFTSLGIFIELILAPASISLILFDLKDIFWTGIFGKGVIISRLLPARSMSYIMSARFCKPWGNSQARFKLEIPEFLQFTRTGTLSACVSHLHTEQREFWALLSDRANVNKNKIIFFILTFATWKISKAKMNVEHLTL